MSYATQADLEARFGAKELLDLIPRDDGAGGIEVDPDRLADGLAYADGLIESYLAARYTLPIAPVPDLLMRLACDLARYRLHAEDPTEVVKTNHKLAMDWLRALGTGVATLPGVDGAPAATIGGVTHSAGERVFTEDTLADWLAPGAGGRP